MTRKAQSINSAATISSIVETGAYAKLSIRSPGMLAGLSFEQTFAADKVEDDPAHARSILSNTGVGIDVEIDWLEVVAQIQEPV